MASFGGDIVACVRHGQEHKCQSLIYLGWNPSSVSYDLGEFGHAA